MITCKEDLLKTYVVNEGEIRSLYVGLCNKFGIEYESNSNASGAVDVTNADYIEVYAGICFYTNTPSKESSRELTIKDLQEKPTKFVKVEESIFDLKEEFERGELYVSTCEGHYTQILGENGLFLAAFNNSIYRQVEVDWSDELGLFLAKKAFDGASVNNLDISDLSDNLGTVSVNLELRFNDFIEMCHKVAELTDKPE